MHFVYHRCAQRRNAKKLVLDVAVFVGCSCGIAIGRTWVQASITGPTGRRLVTSIRRNRFRSASPTSRRVKYFVYHMHTYVRRAVLCP